MVAVVGSWESGPVDVAHAGCCYNVFDDSMNKRNSHLFHSVDLCFPLQMETNAVEKRHRTRSKGVRGMSLPSFPDPQKKKQQTPSYHVNLFLLSTAAVEAVTQELFR